MAFNSKKEANDKRPSWDEYFMEMADTVSKRATCDRGKSGCVIVRDKQLLVSGYVGSPMGFPHCDEAGHQMKQVTHEDAAAFAPVTGGSFRYGIGHFHKILIPGGPFIICFLFPVKRHNNPFLKLIPKALNFTASTNNPHCQIWTQAEQKYSDFKKGHTRIMNCVESFL